MPAGSFNRAVVSLQSSQPPYFEARKLPVATWLRSAYLVIPDMKGSSSMMLTRHLKVFYSIVWRIKQRFIHLKMGRDQWCKAVWLHRSGGCLSARRAHRVQTRGVGAERKIRLMNEIETTRKSRLTQFKLPAVKGFRSPEIATWSERHLGRKNITVISGGLTRIDAIVGFGSDYDKIVFDGGHPTIGEPELHWGNTVLGNSKSTYCLNLRFELYILIPRLICASIRMPPVPGRLLKIGLC